MECLRSLRRFELGMSMVKYEGSLEEKDGRGYGRMEVTTKVRQVTTE